MVGGFPRKAGMERKDVMAKNVSIYKSQASSLEKNAAQGVKVPAPWKPCHCPDPHVPRVIWPLSHRWTASCMRRSQQCI